MALERPFDGLMGPSWPWNGATLAILGVKLAFLGADLAVLSANLAVLSANLRDSQQITKTLIFHRFL